MYSGFILGEISGLTSRQSAKIVSLELLNRSEIVRSVAHHYQDALGMAESPRGQNLVRISIPNNLLALSYVFARLALFGDTAVTS